MVKRVVIDCEKLSERRQAHEYLAEALSFPEYYGKKLDALFDCLTELGECTVILEGAEKVRGSGDYGERVIKVMEAAAHANPLLELEVSAPSDKLISVLLGLVGACGNNPNTENTDAVIVKALALSRGCSGDEEREVIDEIISEKNAVSPGCAVCAMPCGNTSDYDMERIYSADAGIRDIKLSLLAKLRDTAAYLYNSGAQLSDETAHVIYKALAYLSYDISEESLSEMLSEVIEINRQIRSEKNA